MIYMLAFAAIRLDEGDTFINNKIFERSIENMRRMCISNRGE